MTRPQHEVRSTVSAAHVSRQRQRWEYTEYLARHGGRPEGLDGKRHAVRQGMVEQWRELWAVLDDVES